MLAVLRRFSNKNSFKLIKFEEIYRYHVAGSLPLKPTTCFCGILTPNKRTCNSFSTDLQALSRKSHAPWSLFCTQSVKYSLNGKIPSNDIAKYKIHVQSNKYCNKTADEDYQEEEKRKNRRAIIICSLFVGGILFLYSYVDPDYDKVSQEKS